MRFFRFLTALTALPVLAHAANKSKFVDLANQSKDGIITLNSALYEELLAPEATADGKKGRDYAVAVVLTALPVAMNCAPCRTFDPIFKQEAASWKRLPKDQREDMFFAVLDFPDGQQIFQKLGLQTAPNLQFHSPTVGPHKIRQRQAQIAYDFGKNGFEINNLHNWITSLAPHTYEMYKPFNPIPYVVAPMVIAFVLAVGLLSYQYLAPLFTSRFLWAAMCIVAILVFTSGHMWNRIRNAPYASPQGFIAPGFSNQFVLETQIVGGLYGLLAASVLILSELVPTIKSSAKQRMAILLWVGVLVFLFSLLVKLFKVKNGGYPFFLLLG
ncbi:oligosaccharyl transferase subunit ost3/OST6 [Naganishia albida]|nr:oligosaccharyl transferase subunit ost3/OST6 [Naganishia albida]